MLLFIDNIFRFTQAGSEVSALLGRMPSAVGYQPTLATEMGGFAGTYYFDEEGGCITSVQAIYVPADDLTDPAPTDVQPLGCETVLSVRSWNWGIYPLWIPLIPAHVYMIPYCR